MTSTKKRPNWCISSRIVLACHISAVIVSWCPATSARRRRNSITRLELTTSFRSRITKNGKTNFHKLLHSHNNIFSVLRQRRSTAKLAMFRQRRLITKLAMFLRQRTKSRRINRQSQSSVFRVYLRTPCHCWAPICYKNEGWVPVFYVVAGGTRDWDANSLLTIFWGKQYNFFSKNWKLINFFRLGETCVDAASSTDYAEQRYETARRKPAFNVERCFYFPYRNRYIFGNVVKAK